MAANNVAWPHQCARATSSHLPQGTTQTGLCRTHALLFALLFSSVAIPDTRVNMPTILIVDDDTTLLDLLSAHLSKGGLKVQVAPDAAIALRTVIDSPPDLVLLDIGLPKLSGHDVCRRIRAESWGKDIVIIALTGWGQEEDRRKSQEAGFDGHLVKPVDYDELLELLISLTNGARNAG